MPFRGVIVFSGLLLIFNAVLSQQSNNLKGADVQPDSIVANRENIEISDLLRLSHKIVSKEAAKSKIYAQIALQKARKANQPDEILNSLYCLAEAEYNLHEYDSALTLYKQTLQLVQKDAVDSLYCKILISLGFTYDKTGQSEFAIKYFKDAVEAAKKKNYSKYLIAANFDLANLYHNLGNYKEALDYYQLCLQYVDSAGDVESKADIYNRIGVVFYDLGSFEKSLNYYMKSMDIVKSLDDELGMANALNNIGIVYYDWGKKEKALEYYQKSLKIEQQLDHEIGMAGSYNNIGIIYSDWNQNDFAVEYYNKALAIYKKYDNKIGIGDAKNNIGESLAATGNFKESIAFLEEGLKIELNYGTSQGVAESFHSIGKTYFEMGNLAKAIEYNKRSYKIADSCNLISLLPEISFLNYRIEKKRGNFKDALTQYISYDQQKKSIYDQQFHDRITELQLKSEINKSEHEKEHLILENIKKEHEIKSQRTYLFIIFILMLIFGSLVYYDIRSKINSNKKLKEINSELTLKEEKLTKTLHDLRKSESKYRNLVGNAPTGILYIDNNGEILEVNKKMLEILGSPDEGETKKINVLTFQPLVEIGVSDKIHSCINSGKLLVDKAEYKTKWGKKLFLKYSITPISDGNDSVTSLILNVEDISKSRQAEHIIRESENKYRMLVENSLQAMLIIQDMKIIFANKKLEEISGYSLKELEEQGKNWLKLIIHPDDARQPIRSVVDALKGKIPATKHEYRIIRKDGQIRWIETLGSMVNFQDKPAMMMVAIDNTERKQAEQILIKSEHQLKNANAMKDKFFSIIAHDLKNPFSAILGFANLLYEAYDNFSESQRKNFIKNIVETSENTFKLLQNLLEWARTQTGNIEYKPKNINLSLITNENLAIFKTSLKSKKIAVELHIPVKLTAWADENMIKAVIRNLLSNAIKFTRSGGNIHVHVRSSNNTVEYCVEDSGVGISKENLKKIFRIDDPLKQPGTDNETGTGIGLLLCKELIEINHGEIKVESELNTGSKFIFTLPKTNNLS